MHGQSHESAYYLQICQVDLFDTTTIDREIFTLKIICVKNFRVVKFSRFCSIRETDFPNG